MHNIQLGTGGISPAISGDSSSKSQKLSPKAQKSTSRLEQLHTDLQAKIFSYLTPPAYARLSRLNRYFRDLVAIPGFRDAPYHALSVNESYKNFLILKLVHRIEELEREKTLQQLPNRFSQRAKEFFAMHALEFAKPLFLKAQQLTAEKFSKCSFEIVLLIYHMQTPGKLWEAIKTANTIFFPTQKQLQADHVRLLQTPEGRRKYTLLIQRAEEITAEDRSANLAAFKEKMLWIHPGLISRAKARNAANEDQARAKKQFHNKLVSLHVELFQKLKAKDRLVDHSQNLGVSRRLFAMQIQPELVQRVGEFHDSRDQMRQAKDAHFKNIVRVHADLFRKMHAKELPIDVDQAQDALGQAWFHIDSDDDDYDEVYPRLLEDAIISHSWTDDFGGVSTTSILKPYFFRKPRNNERSMSSGRQHSYERDVCRKASMTIAKCALAAISLVLAKYTYDNWS